MGTLKQDTPAATRIWCRGCRLNIENEAHMVLGRPLCRVLILTQVDVFFVQQSLILGLRDLFRHKSQFSVVPVCVR